MVKAITVPNCGFSFENPLFLWSKIGQKKVQKIFKKSSKKVEKVVDFTFGRDYNASQPKRKRVEFRSKITAL